MHKLWPAVSLDSFKQKFLCAFLTQGPWIEIVNSRRKVLPLSLSLPLSYSPPFHSPVPPPPPLLYSSTGDNLVFDIQKQHKLKTKVNHNTKVGLFFFLGKSSSLKCCKLRQHWALWHPWVDVTSSVRMCIAWTLFLFQGIMINTAGVKCGYQRLLGRLISGRNVATEGCWEGWYLTFWAETGSYLWLLSFHIVLPWGKHLAGEPEVKADTFPVYNERPRRTEKRNEDSDLPRTTQNREGRLQSEQSTEISFKETGERCSSGNLACPLTGRYKCMWIMCVFGADETPSRTGCDQLRRASERPHLLVMITGP